GDDRGGAQVARCRRRTALAPACGARGGRHGRAAGTGDALQERLLDARRHQSREERRGARGGERRQHRRTDGHLALRAEDHSDLKTIEAELKSRGAVAGPRLRLRAAREVVGMDEPPAQAMRYKKDSSMRVAINLVKSGEAHAAVSAGNTGALMAISRFVLKTIQI